MTHRNDLINSGFVAVTPSDSTQVAFVGLMCGVAGNVSVTDALGVTTTLAMQAGQTITGQITKVNATLTTASGLVGLVA